MRKSTLSHTTVFLQQVMRFAKLNKPPLSIKPPLPPGGLIEDLRYIEMGSQTVHPTSTANNIIKNGWNFHEDCLFWLSYFSLDYWLDTTFLLIDTRHNSLFGDS